MNFKKGLFNLILILLCVSFGLYSPHYVSATDVSTSEISAPSDIHALQSTIVTVTAKGTAGAVSNANVNISTTNGLFPDTGKVWIVGTTNSSGMLSVIFKAPDTDNETSNVLVTLSAEITSDSDTIIVEHNITVHPIDLSVSSLTFTPSNVYEDHNVTVSVLAQGPYGVIEGATVDLTATDGVFVDSGVPSVNETTDENGQVTILWTAPFLTIGVTSLEVNISATISFTGKTVSTFLSENITVYPIDFNSSSISFSDTTVNGGYSIDVTVNAIGDIGGVSNANVMLDALDGQFSNGLTTIEGITDETGKFETEWTAPNVDADIIIDFTATLTYTNVPQLKEVTGSVTVISVVHNITISLNANSTSVTVGQFVSINLEIVDEVGQPINNANATFTATEGKFVSTDDISVTVSTDENGLATVTWDTSSLAPPVGGLDYIIEVTVIKEYYNTNSSTISIHVNPEAVQLVTQSIPSPNSIKQGENVTIAVLVTDGSNPIEGATVQIVAQDGVFDSSGSAVALKNTNSSGYAVFIWITKDMVVTTAKNYTFTVTASFPGYTDAETETVTIEVQPHATSTETSLPTQPTGGNDIMKQLGILFGVVGGIAILGAVGYLILRNKPVT